MVDVNKGKEDKSKKPTKLPDINIKSLIFGAAIYAFFPLVSVQQGIDLLTAFAAFGPIYIGYEARTELKAILLGIVGGTPLLYLSFMGYLGAYTATNTADLTMTVVILGLAALMGWFGSYLYKSRAKAKKEYADTRKGTKNVPVKPNKRKLEDTGSVKQNIINMFKPRR